MKKGTRNTLLLIGTAGIGVGIWYLTKPKTPPVIPPAVLPPGITPVITTHTNPTATTTTVVPVIKGSEAKVGDKLWASGADVPIYINVNPGTKLNNFVIPKGNYAGQVVDISPFSFIKVIMWSGAPIDPLLPKNSDGSTYFYLPKSSNYTVGT